MGSALFVRCRAFELVHRQRWDARNSWRKLYTVPAGRSCGPTVEARLERGVRPQSSRRSAKSNAYEAKSTSAAMSGKATHERCLQRVNTTTR